MVIVSISKTICGCHKVKKLGEFEGEKLRSMSGGPRVRSMNVADSEVRPVLGPAGNKTMRSLSTRKPVSKPLRKADKTTKDDEEIQALPPSNGAASSPLSHSVSVPLVLRRQEQLLHSNLSLNASCSSDASTDSFHSRASTGRITRSSSTARRRPYASKPKVIISDAVSESPTDGLKSKRRCAWVTPNTGMFVTWFWNILFYFIFLENFLNLVHECNFYGIRCSVIIVMVNMYV